MNNTATTGTTVAALPTSVTPDLTVIDGMIYTTSTQVAQHFGKTHRSVLKSIRNIIALMAIEHLHHFAQVFRDVDAGNGAVTKYAEYRITRYGFSLLAMGFTGKEAFQWKLTFLDTFERMEAELTAPTLTITPAQCQHLSELVDLVVESGRQKTHAETWARFHRKMKVNKYALLKPEHFDAACDYLRGKLDDTSIAAIAQKHFPQVAALAAPTQQTNTMTTIEAPSLANRRWLVYFDHTGREHHQAVPNDAVVLSPKELPEMLRNGVFPAQAVMEIAYAVNMHQFQISCSNPRRGYGEDVVKKIKSGIDDADLYAITVAATMETLMRTTPPLQAVAA